LPSVQLVAREGYLEAVHALKEEGFGFLADLTCVDYLTNPSRDVPEGVELERFEVVVNLRRFDPPDIARLRVQVPERDPRLPSLYPLYPGADAMEREVFDLFGISFDGHPDLSRILLPEDWEGHPLRKDYAVGRVPVQFKEVRRNR
jgi:NADH-quinone oxidoreductase subunit C